MRAWHIRRASRPGRALYELRAWNVDPDGQKRPEKARILAYSVTGARAMLPSGSTLAQPANGPITLTEGTEWWLDPVSP